MSLSQDLCDLQLPLFYYSTLNHFYLNGQFAFLNYKTDNIIVQLDVTIVWQLLNGILMQLL